MACPITVAKFVGMVSIGMSTGLSYAVSSIALPALQALPTAAVAAQALTDIQYRARRSILTLSHITVITLISAFSLSSPRRRHPYLLWTSAFTLVGGLGLELVTNHTSFIQGTESPSSSSNNFGQYLSSLCCSSKSRDTSSSGSCLGSFMKQFSSSPTPEPAVIGEKTDDEESFGNSSEIELIEPPSEAESTGFNTAATTEKATPASSVSDINGETVAEYMKRERDLHIVRTYLHGIAFSMGVIGIWGERTT